MSLENQMRGRIARYADRRDDWNVFGLETKIDPKYARSQRRYIGASGSVDHAETNAVEPVAFTMSIQTMPGGNRIPVHCHETEETFFILEGECTVNVFLNGETFRRNWVGGILSRFRRRSITTSTTTPTNPARFRRCCRSQGLSVRIIRTSVFSTCRPQPTRPKEAVAWDWSDDSGATPLK